MYFSYRFVMYLFIISACWFTIGRSYWTFTHWALCIFCSLGDQLSHFGCSMADSKHGRTPGTDLEDKIVWDLFDNYVPRATCSPQRLWELKSITEMNKTSDWAAISRASGLLCDLVRAGHGLIPKQQKLHNQFVEWLSYRCNETWKYKESDGCILRLRAMLQSLLSRKRDGQGAPRNYPQLQAIMDDLRLQRFAFSDQEQSIVPLESQRGTKVRNDSFSDQEQSCASRLSM